MNKGTTKIKAIAKRALEIREKGGFKTETITKKRYNVAYIPDAIKQAAKELKKPETSIFKVGDKVNAKSSNFTSPRKVLSLKHQNGIWYCEIQKGNFWKESDLILFVPKSSKAKRTVKTSGLKPNPKPEVKRTKRVVKTSAFKPVITNIYVKAYRKVKEKHSDAIVLLRVGDFFETFDVDAKIISEKLNITLIKTKSRYHCAGFPNHRLENYLTELVKNHGLKVAIVDEPEKIDVKNIIIKESKRTKRVLNTRAIAKKAAPAPVGAPLKLVSTVEKREKRSVKKFIRIKQSSEKFYKRYGIKAISLYNAMQLEKYKYLTLANLYEVLTKLKAPENGEPYVNFVGSFVSELNENGKYLSGKKRIDKSEIMNYLLKHKQTLPAKLKPGIYGLSIIASDDDYRPVMAGVYVDNGSLVATDANKLVVISDNEDLQKKWNEKIIGVLKKNLNQKIDGRFPDYKRLIPGQFVFKSKNFDVNNILSEVHGRLNALKSIDGQFATKKSDARGILMVEDAQVHIHLGFLSDLLNVLRSNGAKTVHFGFCKELNLIHSGLITIKSDNGNLGLIMPLMPYYEENKVKKDSISNVEPIKII